MSQGLAVDRDLPCSKAPLPLRSFPIQWENETVQHAASVLLSQGGVLVLEQALEKGRMDKKPTVG